MNLDMVLRNSTPGSRRVRLHLTNVLLISELKYSRRRLKNPNSLSTRRILWCLSLYKGGVPCRNVLYALLFKPQSGINLELPCWYVAKLIFNELPTYSQPVSDLHKWLTLSTYRTELNFDYVQSWCVIHLTGDWSLNIKVVEDQSKLKLAKM